MTRCLRREGVVSNAVNFFKKIPVFSCGCKAPFLGVGIGHMKRLSSTSTVVRLELVSSRVTRKPLLIPQWPQDKNIINRNQQNRGTNYGLN